MHTSQRVAKSSRLILNNEKKSRRASALCCATIIRDVMLCFGSQLGAAKPLKNASC